MRKKRLRAWRRDSSQTTFRTVFDLVFRFAPGLFLIFRFGSVSHSEEPRAQPRGNGALAPGPGDPSAVLAFDGFSYFVESRLFEVHFGAMGS